MSELAKRISPTNPNKSNIVISIDAMGGDNGPTAVISGIEIAAKSNPNIKFIINGDKAQLEKLVGNRKNLNKICEIRHSPDVISMNDKPSHAMRHGKNSSMWGTIDAVKDKDADAEKRIERLRPMHGSSRWFKEKVRNRNFLPIS